MKIIGYITMFLLFTVSFTILNGLVFCLLWKWFVASTFDVQSLTLLQSIGLGIFANFNICKPDLNKQKEKVEIDEFFIRWFSVGLAYPFTYLVIGWFVHLWCI
jgi:hypothetical protein